MKNSFGLSLFPGMKTLRHSFCFGREPGSNAGGRGRVREGAYGPKEQCGRLAPRRGADSERTDLVQARPEAAAENPGAPYLCLMTL